MKVKVENLDPLGIVARIILNKANKETTLTRDSAQKKDYCIEVAQSSLEINGGYLLRLGR
ncbi:MAG: hypothetical protein RLZZ490_1783 [Cyanobacteriota bacterium]